MNIYDYLQDFEKMDLPNDNGIILEDKDKVKWLDDYEGRSHNSISYYKVGDNNMFVKSCLDMSDRPSYRYLSELLGSKIYEDNGVNCVRSYPFIRFNDIDKKRRPICSATEDLCKIPNLIASNDKTFLRNDLLDLVYNIQSRKYDDIMHDEWLIIRNEADKQYLLKFMTKECYEQLVDVIILEPLFFSFDRFGGDNLFFVKSPYADKWEGVVLIDLESINFDVIKTFYHGSVNKFLNCCFTDEVDYYTPQNILIHNTHPERLKSLKQLIKEGGVTPRQKRLIKGVLYTNITGELNSILDKYNLGENKKVSKVYSEFWERNGDILGL